MIYIPALFLLPLFIFALSKVRKRKGGNQLPVLIISLYFFGAILTIFVDAELWYPYFNNSSYSVLNFSLYAMVLLPFLIPVFRLRPLSKKTIFKKSKLQTLFLVILILFGLYSFSYQLPFAIASVTLGVSEVRSQQNNLGAFLLPPGLMTTVAVATSYFYYFYLIFFFIALQQQRSAFFRVLLIVGSLSYIISGLTFGTRDVFVNYMFALLFCVLYFKNVLTPRTYLKIKRLFKFVAILAFLGIASISIERFAERKNDFALAYGTIGYVGQQPYVFSETIEMHDEFYNGNLRFSVFKSMFTNVTEVNRTKHYETSFGTFTKDIYAEGGFPFLIISMITFPAFFVFFQKLNSSNKIFSKIILDIYLFQFLTTGFFYYTLGSRAGNIYTIILFATFFVYHFLKLLTQKNRREFKGS